MDTVKLNCEKKPLMVAHRGVSGLEMENTASAFVAAGNRTYFGIETDIHRTDDGKYILIHDDDTARVAGDKLVVEETSFDTLRRLTLRNGVGGEKDRADLMLPTLAEYIGICKKYGKVAVLELKNAFAAEDIYEICAALAEMEYLDRVVFISFHYENLVLLRRKYPTQSAQFLTKEFGDDLIDKLLAAHVDLDIRHTALTAERIARCHENGIKVNAWTVDDPARAAELAAWGIDYITTNILE